LTIRSDGSKLPVHFRYDELSMTYAARNSAKTASRRPQSAIAGIVESTLDIGLVTAVVAAEDALARLDERLAKSPIRAGWIARAHFHDACASLWLAGALVHLEDLVLHDAAMDLRTPTHELTRAHAVPPARRRIADARPGVFSPADSAAWVSKAKATTMRKSRPLPCPFAATTRSGKNSRRSTPR
jgi:hypothetical protein